MPLIFDMRKVLKYYLNMKGKGEAKIKLEEALEKFSVEEGIKKAEKSIKTKDNVYVVPSVTGKERIIEIDGEIFIEVI